MAEIEAPAVAAKSEHDSEAKAEAKPDAVAAKPVAEKATDAKVDGKAELKVGESAVVAEAVEESPAEAVDTLLEAATTAVEAVAPVPAVSGDKSA